MAEQRLYHHSAQWNVHCSSSYRALCNSPLLFSLQFGMQLWPCPILSLAHQVTLQKPCWAFCGKSIQPWPRLVRTIRPVQGAAGQGDVQISSEFNVFTLTTDTMPLFYPSDSSLVLEVWEKPAEDCKWWLWLWQILQAKFISKLSERIVSFSHQK